MALCSNCKHSLHPGDRFCSRCGTVAGQNQSQLITAFISYSHSDATFTDLLRKDLSTKGIKCWIDHENLPPGTRDWENAVRKGIEISQVIILIASPESRESLYVRDELALAQKFEHPVVPIWIAGQDWMDAIPLGWGRTQHIDARQVPQGVVLEQVLSALDAIMDTSILEPLALTTMGPKVFLCHSHYDDSFAHRIARDLSAAGADVWYDDKKGLMGGEDWVRRINEELTQSQWLALLLSPAAISSIWVQHEVNAAINRTFSGKMKGIIAISAEPIDPDQTPPLWKIFPRYDGTQDYDAALSSLLAALEL